MSVRNPSLVRFGARDAAPARPVRTAAVAGVDRATIIPESAHTHEGFRTWVTSPDCPEKTSAWYIGGIVQVDMSPESVDTHNKVKAAVLFALENLNRRLDLGEVYADGVLLTHRRAGISVEPDAMFVLWESLESDRIRRVPRKGRPHDSVELEGSPDVVVEVLSDSSVRKDVKLLREGYFRAGAAEYWLIDARGDDLSFQILRRGAAGFRAAGPVDAPQRSTVLRRTFALSRIRGRMGLWRYTMSAS